MYSKTTNSITVSVEATYLPTESSPAQSRYFWAYRVRIENHGQARIQLRSRAWSITDAAGHAQEVRGAGVVGEQPVLGPGETYEYQSGTPLATPSGMMVGHYVMEGEDGERFEIPVPAFSLDSPHEASRLN